MSRFYKRRPVTLDFSKSIDRTRPEFEAESNIANIIARYRKTGVMPQGVTPPRFEDFTGAVDYHDMMNRLHDARDAFLSLPATTREYFGNDPAQYLAAVEEAHAPDADPDLRADLVELGILNPPPPESPPAPPASDPASTPPGAPPTSPAAE